MKLFILGLITILSSHQVFGGPCDNAVSISTSWPGGYTATLIIPITTTVSSWSVDVTFTAAISTLEVWNAVSTTADKKTFRLNNMSYNGAQNAGTNFNTAGFNVWYPSSNAFPAITSVLFNGVNVCSVTAPNTAAPTTAAPVTTVVPTTVTVSAAPTTVNTVPPSTAAPTTVAPVTTSAPGSCSSVASVSSAWPGGLTATLIIPVSISVTSWNIDVTFSAIISGLQVWNAQMSSTNNIQFRLTNMNYNGVQNAGTIFNSVGFNVAYPAANPSPTIVSVVFNGINVCSAGAAPTTASVVTTTQPPAGSTAAPVSVTTPAGAATSTVPSNSSVTPLNTKYNYAEVITKSLLFYYVQRSGRLPTNDNPIPYRSDSALGDVGQNGEDLTGGYYDAGDFVKFGFPMAFMTTVIASSVLDYPLGYSSAGQLTNARNMVKWASDYFIKAHVAPNKLYGQVGDGYADHSYWGRPEDMTMARPASSISTSSPGSDLAGETAAALAVTSMVFAQVNATYAASCLSHAKDLYTFAKQYQGLYSSSISQAGDFYRSSGYGDELAWAAVWLYRATQDVAYLNDAKAYYDQYGLGGAGEFSWDSKAAGVQVMLAKVTNDPTYINAIKSFCDSKVNQPKTPKGLVFISQWGSLRHASNVAYICLQAADLGINSLAYRKLAQQQIHYALGDTGRSFVCGFGTNPPVRSHHRSSSCPNKPATCDWNTYNSPAPNAQILYGALVGGPDSNDNYDDNRQNYVTNEVATDYNAGFQSAVAALQTLAVSGQFV
ncbi:endoglucase-1 [Daphnia sinensis]|uniref:Endoglucanase n=1 Tax=Daphnia sinensis TaxID=1820382 RepID=A0AAD5L510_9CRUS|nr:endoglucase-1 [Daphnia sinensis]